MIVTQEEIEDRRRPIMEQMRRVAEVDAEEAMVTAVAYVQAGFEILAEHTCSRRSMEIYISALSLLAMARQMLVHSGHPGYGGDSLLDPDQDEMVKNLATRLRAEEARR